MAVILTVNHVIKILYRYIGNVTVTFYSKNVKDKKEKEKIYCDFHCNRTCPKQIQYDIIKQLKEWFTYISY
jgi:glycine betaine/choline ABC-type transport system substrate-binding protein